MDKKRVINSWIDRSFCMRDEIKLPSGERIKGSKPRIEEERVLKGAIFDLDGVLVNTVPLHFKAWKKMFGEYGYRFNFQHYKKKVDGIPRLDGAKAILKDLPKKELEKAADRKQRYYLEFLKLKGVKVFKDALNLIKKLRDDHIKIAVISSSRNCLYILKRARLTHLFDAIVTGEDIKKGKPDPEIFLLASKKLRLKPLQCVVFEDSLLGIESAKRGNFLTVGIDRHRDSKRLSQADLVVGNFSSIKLNRLKAFLK